MDGTYLDMYSHAMPWELDEEEETPEMQEMREWADEAQADADRYVREEWWK